MGLRNAKKVYCWNYDGRNDCAVLAASWKEAVANTNTTVHFARQFGGAHIVGESWIVEWPYERGKPMYRPISERNIPWRETPYRLTYDKSGPFAQSKWV